MAVQSISKQLRPSGDVANKPLDARTEVNSYNDFQNLTGAYVGMHVYVKNNYTDSQDIIHPKGEYVITEVDSYGDITRVATAEEYFNITKVEANPTGEATTPLNKIKIGGANYNIPQTDTSDFATKTELQQGLSGKQDTIDDLATIRSGAAAGATAVQPDAIANMATKPSNPSNGKFVNMTSSGELKNSGFDETSFATAAQGAKADTAVQSVSVGTTATGNAGTNASVTNTGTQTNPVLDFIIPRGQDAYNPFRGTYIITDTLPTNGQNGDYIYVIDSATPPVTHVYAWNGTIFEDTLETVTIGTSQFANSSKLISQTDVVNDFTTGGTEDVLSAEQGKKLANNASFYPWANTINLRQYDNCIVDANIFGYTGKIGLFTLQATSSNNYYIRLCAVKDDNTVDASVGTNGVICTFIGNFTKQHGYEILTPNTYGTGITDVTVKLIVDIDKFPTETTNQVSSPYRVFSNKTQVSLNTSFETGEQLSIVSISNEPIENNQGLVRSGGVFNKLKYPSYYPYANNVNVNEYDNCIVDLNISGYDGAVGLFDLYNISSAVGDFRVRICALNQDGTVNASVGSSGIVLEFTGFRSTPAKIEKFSSTTSHVTGVSGSIVVDFTKYPSSNIIPTLKRSFSTLVLTRALDSFTKQGIYDLTPIANEVVWSNKTYFPTLNWLKDFVVSMELNTAEGVTYDTAIPICIGQISITPNGRTFITIHQCSTSGNAPYSGTSQICLYDNNSWTLPSADVGGHRYQTLSLSQRNSSGVVGKLVVDWSAVPNIASLVSNVLYREFDVLNALLSTKVFKGTSSAITGSHTIDFQIDGVNALLKTSNLYTPDGTPDWLMIISHGNGMGDSLSSAMPGSNGNESWFLNHGISLAVIRTQDEESTPYTTNATGWGNSVCIARTIKLYNYLMEHYNFRKTVILAGESMGGCTMGALAYKKPFPIAFCLGVGPVPGVKIMFQNSSATYKASIRAAYGMNSDGSDDANIANFVKGYDWYDMGLIENDSNVKQKVCYPNVYMYHGDDSTYTSNFGGDTQYQEIVNALLAGGSYSMMKNVTGSHANTDIYAVAITDGVFERELGIN